MPEPETLQNQQNSSEDEIPALVVEAAPDSELANSEIDPRSIKIFCHNCQQKLDVTSLQPFARIACPSCGAELIIPKWFDTYLLEEPCGIGGMSSVYRALDIALDREVAIKILNPEIAPESERSALFLNEARTAATINHYSVVPIYTCGVFNGQTYIVMQFMNGGSLETKLNNSTEPLPIPDVVKWIRDIAEGLENACRHGIVHHDIKPGNIMLDSDGNAKIGDFGIAQSILASPETLASAKETWVSPLYVSPEKVATGEENSQGDIYSLGATFYHLLTGKPPFQSENLEELIWCRTKQTPVPPNQIRSEIPLALTSLIMRMMHRYPDMRPSYQEVISSLDTFLKNPEMVTVTILKRNPLSRSAIYVPSGGASPSSAKPKAPSSLRPKSPSSVKPKSPSSIMRRTSSSIQQPSPPKSTILNPFPPMSTPQPPQIELQPTVVLDPAYGWLRNKYLIAGIVVVSVMILALVVFGLIQLLNAQDPKVLPDLPETKHPSHSAPLPENPAKSAPGPRIPAQTPNPIPPPAPGITVKADTSSANVPAAPVEAAPPTLAPAPQPQDTAPAPVPAPQNPPSAPVPAPQPQDTAPAQPASPALDSSTPVSEPTETEPKSAAPEAGTPPVAPL